MSLVKFRFTTGTGVPSWVAVSTGGTSTAKFCFPAQDGHEVRSPRCGTGATVRGEPLYLSCRIRQGLYVGNQLDYLPFNYPKIEIFRGSFPFAIRVLLSIAVTPNFPRAKTMNAPTIFSNGPTKVFTTAES